MPHVELAGGMGLGISGPQVAVMPHVHIGTKHLQVSYGVGVSAGPLYQACEDALSDPLPDCRRDAQPPIGIWGNVEVGVQYTSDTGTTFRLFSGLGKLVKQYGECGENAYCGERLLPYLGFAIGKAF